ncbi:hypothetical protein M426DRAFT_16018 [Hypoxylon sp. CI-4A]|nr:hypothetical protein M426DRAFT_16018 [Hypoxylon sp. CI-4A]
MATIMIPEILYLICSFLDIEDVRRFRLCSRDFADIAARVVHRQVVFYLHYRDLEMLRSISLHPIASRNVHSLVYVGDTLARPKKSFEEFRDTPWNFRNEPLDRVRELYENYKTTIDHEERILADKEDFACLREVIPRFTALRDITFSCDRSFWNHDWVKKTPFQDCYHSTCDELEPFGCRQLDSLLGPISENGIRLKSLAAGLVGWEIFKKPLPELRRALPLYSDLTCLKLVIRTGDPDNHPADPDDPTGRYVPQVRRLLGTGLLRESIKSLTQLQTLSIVFDDYSSDHGWPARLEDILEPGHKWEHLTNLTLGTVICERQELLTMLMIHRTTLRQLCLANMRLGSTFWIKLLPGMRRVMDLEDSCICGDTFSQSEEAPYRREFWGLEDPLTMNYLRDDVNDYVCGYYQGGHPLIDSEHLL